MTVLVATTGVGALWVRGDFTPVARVEDPWSSAGQPPAPHGFGFGDATPAPQASPDSDLWPAFADPELPPAGSDPTATDPTSADPTAADPTADPFSGTTTSGDPVPTSPQPTIAAGSASLPSVGPTILPAPEPTAADPMRTAQEVARDVEARAATTPAAPVEVTVATFNVLGSVHTAPGGNRAEMASGTERIEGVRELLTRHDVSVAGLQEFLPDQRRTFARRVPGWELYPALGADKRTGENSVAWRSDTWDLVQPAMVQVPDAYGVERPLPYVLLRHRASGLKVYVSTFHNPADTRLHHHQEPFREAAEQREVEVFNRLEKTGVPQLVTGDMNERRDYFCAITSGTPLTTPAGGSNDGTCRPPSHPQIDWIFGSPGVQWTGYTVDRDDLVRRTSDHPIVVAGARLDPADYPRAFG